MWYLYLYSSINYCLAFILPPYHCMGLSETALFPERLCLCVVLFESASTVYIQDKHRRELVGLLG